MIEGDLTLQQAEALGEKLDVLLPFQLESSPVRGRLVRLDRTMDDILGRHNYPAPVGKLLAQAAPLAAALATALKFDGVFTIQTQSNGPVRLLAMDVTSEGAVRACAQFDETRLGEESLLGQGTLVFTVDQTGSDERYQGVVQLESDRLIEAFQLYFRQSEQIPTGLFVAARQDESGHWHGGCLMLQRMPSEGGVSSMSADTAQEDDWHRIMTLMQTCTEEELTDPELSPATLVYRLFHEEGVRVFTEKEFHHACRCSRDKVKGALSGIPYDQLEDMAKEEGGNLTVTCQFCAESYQFALSEFL